MACPELPYVSLESPSQRAFALEDARGFLRTVERGAILDEIQRAPDLTSYLQEMVDEDPTPGRFILTGSQDFSVMEAVSQSLAGRTGILELLPLTLDETKRFPDSPKSRFEFLVQGGYPALFDRLPERQDWLGSYITTYVERDVRQVLNVGNLLTFQTFLKLCAGRSGQLLNLSSLGADAGINYKTAQAWISVLEAGYIVYRLPPWFGNVKKRLVKTPKLYFTDTGLLCYLLGIHTPGQLLSHPLRGAIFENWVIGELRKSRMNLGRRPDYHFYRDRKGLEVDLLIPAEPTILAIEIKSGETISRDFLRALEQFSSIPGVPHCRRALIYGGEQRQERTNTVVVPWSEACQLLEGL